MSVDSDNIDFDLLFQNDETRKILDQYLKNLNDSSDILLKVYTILICSIQIRNDRQRTKQILEKTYNLVNKNQLSSFLNADLCNKFCETLQKTTYNESVFNAVKREIKQILEDNYFPKFIKSKIFKTYVKLNKNSKKNQSVISSQLDDLIEKCDIEHSKNKSTSFAKPSVYTTNNHLSNSKINRTFSSSSASSSSSINSFQQSGIRKSIANISKNEKKETNFLNKPSSNTISTRSLSQSMPPNPYHVNSSYQSQLPVSCQDSEIQSMISGVGGYDSQLEDDTLTNTSQLNSTKTNNKANVSTISASSTNKYSNRLKKQSLIANKNAQINLPQFDLLPPQPNPLMLNGQELESMKKQLNGQTCHEKRKIPPQISESDPRKFFDILSSKLEKYIQENENNKQLKMKSHSNTNINPTYNQSNMIDLDSQLDEHLDRIYNNQSINRKPSKSPDKISLINQFSNKLKFNDYKNNMIIDSHSSNKMNNGSFLSLKTTNKNRQNNSMNHSHHFYQLTNTCKEVDIDSQNIAKTQISKDHDSGCSGVSLRSTSSIERVNDWLSNTCTNETKNQQKNGKIISNNKLDEKTNEVNIKTPVAYYMPGEEVAYMSTFNGSNITLNQFKQLITKKGAFRYFFKTKCNLLDDEECVVFQEATDDNSYVPMFNNKVIAKIEKISN